MKQPTSSPYRERLARLDALIETALSRGQESVRRFEQAQLRRSGSASLDRTAFLTAEVGPEEQAQRQRWLDLVDRFASDFSTPPTSPEAPAAAPQSTPTVSLASRVLRPQNRL